MSETDVLCVTTYVFVSATDNDNVKVSCVVFIFVSIALHRSLMAVISASFESILVMRLSCSKKETQLQDISSSITGKTVVSQALQGCNLPLNISPTAATVLQ